MKKIVAVSWEKYLELIQKVYQEMKNDGYTPDHVVAIVRGGLLIGTRLSYLFDRPLAVIAAEHWPQGQKADRVTFARHIVFKTDTVKGKILLCDDLTETGETLIHGREYLMNKFPGTITAIRTAVIFHKEWSKYTPDYYGEFMKKDEDGEVPWVFQPTENPEIILQ